MFCVNTVANKTEQWTKYKVLSCNLPIEKITLCTGNITDWRFDRRSIAHMYPSIPSGTLFVLYWYTYTRICTDTYSITAFSLSVLSATSIGLFSLILRACDWQLCCSVDWQSRGFTVFGVKWCENGFANYVWWLYGNVLNCTRTRFIGLRWERSTAINPKIWNK